MTAPVDICNRSLSSMGARAVISSLTDTSPAGVQCALLYNPTRLQLLRTAPWGFCRKTINLNLLGALTNSPPNSPYPWLYKYLWPSDCIKFRYLLAQPPTPPPTTSVPNVSYTPIVPWCAAKRTWRYVVSYDDSGLLLTPPTPAVKVLLSNVQNAIGVYNADVQDCDRWDDLFQEALVNALAYRLIIPLSGNVGMKEGFRALTDEAIQNARTADGNEAIPTTDHLPDWIAARAQGGADVWGSNTFGTGLGFDYGGAGLWNAEWDGMGWGM